MDVGWFMFCVVWCDYWCGGCWLGVIVYFLGGFYVGFWWLVIVVVVFV